MNYTSNSAHSGETSFTNNAGFYRQDFYAAPASTAGTVSFKHQAGRLMRKQASTYDVVAGLGAMQARANGLLVTASEFAMDSSSRSAPS